MKGPRNQEKFRILYTCFLVMFFISFSSFFVGCSQKTIAITKYKYIEKKCPKLKTFEKPPKLILTAYNKDNKVCIKEWNGCIKKDSFLKLVHYIKSLQLVIKNYEDEINLYNKRFLNDGLSKNSSTASK